jgi:hypothetical protein
MIKMEFYDWFDEKYFDWSGDGKKSENQFAVFLKISQATVNAWRNRSRGKPTSKKIINRLTEVYGDSDPRVYEILGVDRPQDEFSQFPGTLGERFRAAAEEIESMLNSGKFAPGSPEHEAAAREIFSRHGFELTDIDIEELEDEPER